MQTIDIDALERAANKSSEYAVVPREWLRKVLNELKAGRPADAKAQTDGGQTT